MFFTNRPRFNSTSVDWLENFIIPKYKLFANTLFGFFTKILRFFEIFYSFLGFFVVSSAKKFQNMIT